MSVLQQTEAPAKVDTPQARIAELERRLAESEAAHAQTKALFQNILDALPVRVFWKDRNSRFLGSNISFARDVGKESTQEVIGKSNADFDTQYAQASGQNDQMVLDSGESELQVERPLTTPDEQGIWLLTDKTPLRDSSEQVVGVVGAYREITEQKERDLALEWALSRSSDIIDLSNALVQVTNTADLLKTLSQFSFTRNYGSLTLFHFEDYAGQQPTAMRLVASMRGIDSDVGRVPIGSRFDISLFPFSKLYMEHPDEVVVIEDTAKDYRLDAASTGVFKNLNIGSFILIPLVMGSRYIGLFQITFEDPHTWSEDEQSLIDVLPSILPPIVNDLRLVGSLEEKVSELNAALIFKDQFLAIMSHELRTPLNAILGYSSIGVQLLTDAEQMPDKMNHMMQRIVANSERLLHLINEILDLSRINAGRLEIVQLPYDLHDTGRTWHEDFAKRVAAKGLTFKFSLDESLPTSIIGDQERLTQIVTNLLENAIKFTQKGEIALTIARSDSEKLVIKVRDTGIGISPTWHNLIFEEFRRVEMDSVRKTGGAGLGLSIVQRLCKLMGGSVTVESELGAGSTFTVTLPIVAEKQPVS